MARYFRQGGSSHEPQWQGDDMSGGKDSRATRIMFHNVNGLSIHGTDGLEMFVNDQVSLEIDIQGITEHCLDTTKFPVYQTAQEIVRRQAPGLSLLSLHSSTETAVNLYKPGGTGFLVLGETVSRLETNGISGDPMGRWSSIHLRRKTQSPITIITAYQVCPRPTNLLGNTAYHQQIRALGARGNPNLHPRRAFIQDMEIFIQSLQARGHEIILGGDFNEALSDKNSGILKLAINLNLTDPFLSKFPQLPSFGTHSLGSRRIDMVFVSPNLLNSIQKIGYAPFMYTKPSDHRPLIIDFDTKSLFGYRNAHLQSISNRGVKTKDKVAVTKFITEWYQQIFDQGGFALQQQIEDNTIGNEEVERLDAIIGSSGKTAEKKCKKRRPEYYSQALIQQRLRVSILRGHLQSLRSGVDRTSQLQNRMKRAGIDLPLPSTIRNTSQNLRQESLSLQQMCQDNEELRQKELAEKIEVATQNGKKSKAQILQAIRKAETHAKTYQILKKMKNRNTASQKIDRIEIPITWPPPFSSIESVNQLEDPKTCQEWKLITNPIEVEYYLLLRIRLHFGQAEGTPFTREPLSTDIDWAASSDAAEHLVAGSYTFHTLTAPNCNDLLQDCRNKAELDSIPAELTREEFQGKIQSWRESTTTSPSGRHLGWYKSLFSAGATHDQEDDNETSLQDMQESIFSLILKVTNYCIRNTYVLNRWKKIVNVMIFKESVNYKIHRLRVIHIYEADFNLLLAVKWRQLLHSADRQQIIHEGQFGGRPGCEAQALTFLEEVKYDIAYLTRRTLFNFDNDASSCYDRIVVPFASVINRKYGLHRKIVAIHANTLQNARYHLKTAIGVSESYYSTCHQYPIHGTGQGSGNSPSIWLFISSTLFDIHSSLSYGATFMSPDGSQSITISMVGFVDDSTGSLNDFQPQCEAPFQELLRRMQYDAQLWNNLLYCTGGKLELPKCSFHVLRFEFRPNGTPIPEIASHDGAIHITDIENNQQIPIPSKRSFESHKTLGHFKSPISRQLTELDNLREKAERISVLISISPLTRQGASLAYHTIYNPSIRYTLPQSYFTQKELDKAQAPSLQKIIAKCGFNRNTSRAIIFAPIGYGGAGFLPWYLLQGEGQVLNFIKHWRTDSIISKTLKIAVQWAQWQAGHNCSIFSDVTFPIPYLECRWLKSLREFLCTINGKLLLDSPLVAAPERSGDIYIMTYAQTSGLFTNQELAIINYCRLYLHVTTLSELLDASGTMITPELYYCKREPWFNPSSVLALQRRPSEYQIRSKWQKLCRQWITSSGALGASFQLGSWLVEGHRLRRRRQSYTAPDHKHKLYYWQNKTYCEYLRDTTDPTLYRFSQESTWTPTSLCTPIKVTQINHDTLRVLTRTSTTANKTPRRPQPKSFIQYIQTLQQWEKFLIEGVHLRYQPHELIHYIHEHAEVTELFAVSDGSTKDKDTTYGWVFGTAQGTILATHSGIGSGAATSHRAEAWGMLSVSLFLYHLCLYTQTTECNCPMRILTFMSDNKSVVSRVNKRLSYNISYSNSTLAPDWDLIEQITTTILKLPFPERQIQWVKGHQDQLSHVLPIEAQYNIIADELAESAYQTISFHNTAHVVLPVAKCCLTINGQMIHSHYSSVIRKTFTLPTYKKYITQRHQWTEQQAERIDWKLLERVITKCHRNHVQISKFLHDKLPTAAELAKSNPLQSNKCQYCDQVGTFHHLLCCSNPLSNKFRFELHESVDTYLSNHEFPATIRHELIQCIKLSLNLQPPENLTVTNTCLEVQIQLGQKSFLKGYLDKQWRHVSNKLFRTYNTKDKGTVLDIYAGLVLIIWEAELKLWEDHLQAQFQDQARTTVTYLDRKIQYQQRIRILYSKKHQCLPSHQQTYFPHDIDEYLETATTAQMRQYLHHYETAISHSIKTATSQPSRTILSFPGFTQLIRISRRSPNILPRTTSSPPPALSQQTPGARGAPSHHKHTRWRQKSSAFPSLRSFFYHHTKPD